MQKNIRALQIFYRAARGSHRILAPVD